jgi:stage V sporulation protein G
MQISDIRVTLRDEDKLKGFVNVTFDNCFIVRGCKIIQGTEGYFVSMPSWKRRDGTYRDIAHPTNMDMRREIEDSILKAYIAKLKEKEMLSAV